jgi:hypothetical protein
MHRADERALPAADHPEPESSESLVWHRASSFRLSLLSLLSLHCA